MKYAMQVSYYGETGTSVKVQDKYDTRERAEMAVDHYNMGADYSHAEVVIVNN